MLLKTCREQPCANPRFARGLCKWHYQAHYRANTLPARDTREMRFWAKVDKDHGRIHPVHGQCWEWTGCLNSNGYGEFGWFRVVKAHRASWFIAHGTWPDLNVLHLCDNRKCVNPAHLVLGTQADNVADMMAKGRQKPGEQRGERNGHAKLTSDDVVDMRLLAPFGATPQALAAEYGVSPATVYDLLARKTWRHVA